MPHNQLLQIRKQKNNNQSIIFYITPKAKHCKGAKILSFLYRIPDFGSLAKDDIVSATFISHKIIDAQAMTSQNCRYSCSQAPVILLDLLRHQPTTLAQELFKPFGLVGSQIFREVVGC